MAKPKSEITFYLYSSRRVLGFPPFVTCPLNSTQIGTWGTWETILGDSDHSHQAASFQCSKNSKLLFPPQVLSRIPVKNLARDPNWSSSALCFTQRASIWIIATPRGSKTTSDLAGLVLLGSSVSSDSYTLPPSSCAGYPDLEGRK